MKNRKKQEQKKEKIITIILKTIYLFLKIKTPKFFTIFSQTFQNKLTYEMDRLLLFLNYSFHLCCTKTYQSPKIVRLNKCHAHEIQ